MVIVAFIRAEVVRKLLERRCAAFQCRRCVYEYKLGAEGEEQL